EPPRAPTPRHGARSRRWVSLRSTHPTSARRIRGLTPPTIMKAAHNDFDLLPRSAADNAINQPMFAVDAPGPPTAEVILQRFWLSDTGKAISTDVDDQRIDTADHATVGLLPVKIIFPTFFGPKQVHSLMSCSASFPAAA